MTTTLIVSLCAGAGALVGFIIMLVRMRKQAEEIGKLKAEVREYARENARLAEANAHARRPAADHDAAVRVLRAVAGKSLSELVSDPDS